MLNRKKFSPIRPVVTEETLEGLWRLVAVQYRSHGFFNAADSLHKPGSNLKRFCNPHVILTNLKNRTERLAG